VKLLDPSAGGERLAACGWHRDATCGSKDVPANINDAQVLDFLRFRGEEARPPQGFGPALRFVKEVASALEARRERYLRELVEEHGSVQCCAYCNFAVGLTCDMQDQPRTLETSMHVVDGYEMTRTFAKAPMKFDLCLLSRAGGAVAEGHWAPTPSSKHPWLAALQQRAALCRNCGFQLGWRYEPAKGAPKECSSPCCTYQAASGREYCCTACRSGGPRRHDEGCEKRPAEAPKAPVSWGLIWRHLRERQRPGEKMPNEEAALSRHKETSHNAGRNDVCPEGHRLRCFCTGQGNGGALPFYYICDLCDRSARGAEHLWGCGRCDYDVCQRCRTKRM